MRTVLSLLVAVGSATAEPAARPDVLVVLSNDYANPHLGCYGPADIKTPNFDAFAKTALRFNRACVT